MTGIAIRTRLENFDKAEDLFRRLETANTQPLMEDIGDYVLSETLLNFDAEQTPEGEAWPQSIRAKEEGGKTLQDRGHLRDSYTYAASATEVAIGSNMIYAAIHHNGGTIRAKSGNLKFKIGDRWVQKKQVDIPARPALGLNEHMHADIGDQVLDFYRELVA